MCSRRSTVTHGEVSVARIRAAPGADFEIGSISKGITGLLYADALDRGEITPTTRLGDLISLAGTPVAQLTLGSLAVHRSGLPRLSPSASPIKKTLSLWLRGRIPMVKTLTNLSHRRTGPSRENRRRAIPISGSSYSAMRSLMRRG